ARLIMPTSPWSPILAPHADALPRAFREQFLLPADARYAVVLDGIMREVWHKRWLAPLFWLLGRMNILVPEAGQNLPTTLTIHAGHGADGAYHIYARRFEFDTPYTFKTLTQYDAKRARPIERSGPGMALCMMYDAKFVPPLTLRHRSETFGLQFGRWRAWFPRWLSRWLFGELRFTQWVDAPDSDTTYIDARVFHPLVGEMFRYRGTFRVGRRAAPNTP
ncbi:MAG: DUF4166 domain-containing protein, partial [Chloroflexota bacterium]